MAELTSKARRKLPASAFAIPPDRYPIHDIAHARNALARVAANGTPEEKRKVARAVARRYGIGPYAEKKQGKATELANGHPPYQWRHGWIPITPDAELIKAKKKSGTAKDQGSSSSGVTVRPKSKQVQPTDAQERSWKLRKNIASGGPEVKKARDDTRAEYARFYAANEVKLSKRETAATDAYIYDSTDINNHARGVKMGSAEAQEHLQNLRAAISRSSLDRDVVLYRGLDASHLPKLKVGDRISDPAPSSSSYDPVIAEDFLYGFDEFPNPKMLIIEAPKGTKALPLANEDFWQREVLFGEKQEFEIKEINGDVIRVVAI